MFHSLRFLAPVVGVLLLVRNAPADASERQAIAEQRILATLDDETIMEFVDTPLRVVVEYLKDLHSIPIMIDNKSLEDVGLGADTPVTFNLRGIAFRSALRQLLADMDLAYVVRNEVLLITSREAAEASLLARIYLVSDLLLSRADKASYPCSGETLIDVIVATVAPDSWNQAGGPGSIEGASFGGADMLVVSQTMEVHAQLGELLEKLRSGIRQAMALRRAARAEQGHEQYGNEAGVGDGFGGGDGYEDGFGVGDGAEDYEEEAIEEKDQPVKRVKDKDRPAKGSDPFGDPDLKDRPFGGRSASSDDPFK